MAVLSLPEAHTKIAFPAYGRADQLQDAGLTMRWENPLLHRLRMEDAFTVWRLTVA
jgi:hypothetical protein